MSKLEKLLAKYEEQIEVIHTNRGEIRRAVKKNQGAREELDKVKDEMREYIAHQMDSGKTLYQICVDEFGKVDRRFHVLFALFR